MTSVVPRYWLTISCSPPWPLTRLNVMPVTPARNSAALTSGRRSGRTIVVISFMSPPRIKDELRDVVHQRVGVVVLLNPARRHDQHIPAALWRLDEGCIVIYHLPHPTRFVIDRRPCR